MGPVGRRIAEIEKRGLPHLLTRPYALLSTDPEDTLRASECHPPQGNAASRLVVAYALVRRCGAPLGPAWAGQVMGKSKPSGLNLRINGALEVCGRDVGTAFHGIVIKICREAAVFT